MRLFVALPLPEQLRHDLVSVAQGLPGARWVDIDDLHLTLRFVGEVPNPLADEIDLALASMRGRGFELAVSGTGLFERSGRVTALWAGVVRNPALAHLQTKVDTAVQRVGVSAERRRFQPHVTLARVDTVPPERLASWVQRHNLLRSGPHPIDRFALFSSQPGADGPVYTPEVEYALSS